MREYQIRSIECFILPKPVYFQCIWLIRDLERLSAAPSHIAESKARIAAVEAALNFIPKDYREGIMKNIIDRTPYPDIAHENTWKKWKQRFIYELAVNLDLI